jgi:hypothetical protein
MRASLIAANLCRNEFISAGEFNDCSAAFRNPAG